MLGAVEITFLKSHVKTYPLLVANILYILC